MTGFYWKLKQIEPLKIVCPRKKASHYEMLFYELFFDLQN